MSRGGRTPHWVMFISCTPVTRRAPPGASVAEAAVVGYPHDIKGQGIYAYVTLMNDVSPSEELRKELVQWVRHEIGPIASPDLIQWAPGLPKTRSGKIMRRLLRQLAKGEEITQDTSTLENPAILEQLKTSA